jgi:hypothetical protein
MADVLDAERGIYGIKIKFPSRIDYFYFSEKLKVEQIESKIRQAERKLQEAKEIQSSIDRGKNLPKRFQINNALVDVKYIYQTKLKHLTESEAFNIERFENPTLFLLW